MNYDLEKMGKSARTVASIFRVGLYLVGVGLIIGIIGLLIQTCSMPFEVNKQKANNTLETFVKDVITEDGSFIEMNETEVDDMIKEIGVNKSVSFIYMENIKTIIAFVLYTFIALNLINFLSNANIKDPFNVKSIKYIKNVVNTMAVLILFPVVYEILESFIITTLPYYNNLDIAGNFADYFKYYLLVYILVLGTKKLESNVKSKEQKEEK